MTNPVNIKMHISTGYNGCEYKDSFEVDRDWWEALSSQQQDEFLNEASQDFLSNHIEVGAWVEEE